MSPPSLDPDICYRAIQTKDRRFDGRLFVGVRTTGIFCRPICPARTPKSQNCQFFQSAAAAHGAGFRPCLRCRPELSPHLFSQVGTRTTVSKALRLIAGGILNEGNVADLATQLNIGERQLRKLFAQHLGTSPIAVAQTQRLLFAKQLLDETSLPVIDVAMAAGFSSLRRFNTVIRETYQRSPTALRKRNVHKLADHHTAGIQLKLPFLPPYNWDEFVRFQAPRLIPGVAGIYNRTYQRTIQIEGTQGIINVRPAPAQKSYLIATLHFSNVSFLAHIVERLHCIFDLDANVVDIMQDLQQDMRLAPLISTTPGLRVPGAWDKFELAIRAILGQQVSVAAATTLASRIVQTYGEPLNSELLAHGHGILKFIFPSPERLATADLTALGIPKLRIRSIQTLAATVAQDPQFLSSFHTLDDAVNQLCTLPGIGPWTAQYIAMRALREPDAFPEGDLGLLHALKHQGYPVTKAELRQTSQAWRPWRAYAAMLLWTSLGKTRPMQETVSA